jgi:hypothetical protein
MMIRSVVRSLSVLWLTCSALLVRSPATAQEVLPDTGIADVDRYDPVVQFGAYSVYVGLTVFPAAARADPARLLIYLPPVAADSLCVEIVSNDGHIRGRFRYRRPLAVGWRILILPTTNDSLRRSETERLAPLAHLGHRCTGERGVSVPAGWGSLRPNLRLRLLLNPENVDWVFASWRGDGRREFPCRLIPYVNRVAYRYSCDLGSPATHGVAELRIQQMDGRTPLRPIYVRIWVPDGF